MAEIVLTGEEREALVRAAEMMRIAAESQLEAYWWSEIYRYRAETIESLLARAAPSLSDDAQRQQADAWMAVYDALREHNPDLFLRAGSGKEIAVAEIKRLAALEDTIMGLQRDAAEDRSVKIAAMRHLLSLNGMHYGEDAAENALTGFELGGGQVIAICLTDRGKYTLYVVNLLEETIREELIKLGWTPPPQEQTP